MLYVDMKEKPEEGKVMHRGSATAIPYMESHINDTVVGGIGFQNGRLCLLEGNNGELRARNMFFKGLTPNYEIGETEESIYPYVENKVNAGSKRKKKVATSKILTYLDIADTAENPIIIVLCDEIGLYRGVEADLKILYMGEDGIMAALISGACTFNGVPLQRCNDVPIEDRQVTRKFDGSGIRSLLSTIDRESGYDYLWDAVHHIKVVERVDGQGSVSISSSSVKQGFVLFNVKPLEEAREAKEKEKARIKEARERREKENAAAVQAMLEKERSRKSKEDSEREAKAKAALDKKEARANGLKVANGDKIVSVGAQDFLAAVAQAGGR